MKKLFHILIIFFTLSTYIFTQENNIPVFRLITEEFSPYNFLSEKKPKGISIDVLEEIFKRAGSSQKIGASEFFHGQEHII
jgi:ABC-type amino acid transport substrate-binding protein